MALKLDELVNEDASRIHRGVFADDDVYQQELQQIFSKNWLYLCHESQIKKDGDFVTTYMGETPVIVARGKNQQIHVSINSCSHRGLPVCRVDSGNAQRFICPYHAWAYDISGELVAMPQERHVQQAPDKSTLGLIKVSRVESYRGLIFGSFNTNIESLDDYLGDQKFYLDTFFNRFPQGVEVIGEPHKWLLNANWKLPVENQLGDVAHGPLLHNSVIEKDSTPVHEINHYGLNCVTKAGHGAAIRYMPVDGSAESVAWGMEGMAAMMGNENFSRYLLNVQATVHERIGAVGARIKGLTYGVYPNLSFLWSNGTLRVSHPRGPGKVEYWSWWVVPVDAPDEVKQLLRTNYNLQFGPAGMLEEEDSEAWTQQYIGSRIPDAREQRYYYGLGLGEEASHPDLPGKVGSCYNEHYARQFYLRWREDMRGNHNE
jgi:phenylpropionate dioxygenase-like ring-hydroxylating dioxygenase large terminal subunit